MNARSVVAVIFLMAAAASPPGASADPRRPVSAGSGTVVVPERFLRRWDPITVFFAGDTGPKAGPEDHPEKYVQLSPSQPGAFTWLDARTLQFRPAEPWPPLARFTVGAGGKTSTLATLMSAPSQTSPARDAEGLDAIEEIRLVFPEPIEPAALARMISIELAPLPGIGAEGASRFLGKDDFTIKPQQRASRADTAGYVVGLHSAIPLGTRVTVHLRLSLDDASIESLSRISFATAEPFRVSAVGCPSGSLPVTREGSSYSRDQAIRCGSTPRQVTVLFSAPPSALGPLVARNLVGFSPAVDGLTFQPGGNALTIGGNFLPETLYRVTLTPVPLTDVKGRALETSGKSELFVFFPRLQPFLRWTANQGLLERFGPQMVPLEGRGHDKVDLRIYPIDPLDRNFWPFPASPIAVDEAKRPPGPGEEPDPWTDPDRAIDPAEIVRRIEALGSPPLSKLVTLPLKTEGRSASFGLDLHPLLASLSGEKKSGSYLVGIRRLDGSTERSWVRVQVTDLALTTVEEPAAVRFTVTSISTGKPVAGARVELEGAQGDREGLDRRWTTLLELTTGPDGSVVWHPTGVAPHLSPSLERVVVSTGDDRLVLDPMRPPDGYDDNQWNAGYSGSWLQWALGSDPTERLPSAQTLSHLFTERPVYRPEETVHVKGYLRSRLRGTLSIPGIPKPQLVVTGPGDLAWSYPVTMTSEGSFHYAFAEKDLPTGTYSASLVDGDGRHYGGVSWQVQAYRLPLFEIGLHAPDVSPLDRTFDVGLTASYYAGGRVVDRPVRWRVTQFPYTWTPQPATPMEGWLFSSDARFSADASFQSSPALEKDGTTDAQGGATLTLDPAIEPTAQPRSYVIEATVTGEDDQTVTNTKSVIALPPFVLGLHVARYLEHAAKIEPSIVVLGTDGKPIAGQDVTVRLLNRQWHSHLAATDFSEGAAKYVTDVVDEKVTEKKVTSGAGPMTVTFPISRAGVYVVELEARDRLGRTQVVTVDLYAGGDEPIAWAKPSSQVFQVATDRKDYAPGETANLVLKSPFQSATALAIVETPDGNRYSWVEVKGGAASFHLPVEGHWCPRLPVHFILMRGRVPDTSPLPATQTDLGKPATMAATAWVDVRPVDNQVQVTLVNPDKAQPGDKVKIQITLKTPQGKPVAGEVTLWLVDQAVLALGQEQRLDPLPDFITPVASRITVRDTRNLALGNLPFAENPGGDQGQEGEESTLLDKVTIRKNFQPVPFYDPAIEVGASGTTTVTVALPDNLTNFKIRAKAASGAERFGVATGTISVRLPLLVQPALPRFVRPGDTFIAAAIGRVVEGGGGPGIAQIKVDGVDADGTLHPPISWDAAKPSRIELPVKVRTPGYDADGNPLAQDVTFTFGVQRSSDGARDAVQVTLPVREDRAPVDTRTILALDAGKVLPIADLPEPARPGTLRRTVLVSDQPGLVKMASGLDVMLKAPYWSLESRISVARSELALKKFRELLHEQGAGDVRLKKDVQDTLDAIHANVDGHGLVAFWPGDRGTVWLTAWTLDFLIEARDAGFGVDQKIVDSLERTLEQALRSDYSNFIDGEAWSERTWALSSLASAGRFDVAYASELARRQEYLDQEGMSEVLLSWARAGKVAPETTGGLTADLWNAIIFRLYQGREVYGGFQSRVPSRNALILPSETRMLAETDRALTRVDPRNPKIQQLTDAIVTLGNGDGWGDTNANASALLALSERLAPPFPATKKNRVDVVLGPETKSLALGSSDPVGFVSTTAPGAGQIRAEEGGAVARIEVHYLPAADGSHVASLSKGFVVTRTLSLVHPGDAPADKHDVDAPGSTIPYRVGDVIEDHVQIVNPKERNYVVIAAPLAAGMEPLNPSLATAPPEAKPSGRTTLDPAYASYLDDQVAFFYDTLPAGTYDFYFRVRAQTPGTFIQPAARAEMLYDATVVGTSPGAKIEISRAP